MDKVSTLESEMDFESKLDDIKFMIDVIKPFLLHNLKCIHFLKYMPLVGKETENRIMKRDRDGDHIGATQLLLEYLRQAEEPGQYAEFRDALRQAGYDHIVSVLEGGDMEENHNEHCELLKIFADPISVKIDPNQLIRHLRPCDILTESDENEIRNCQNQHSREHAVFVLFDLVHRRKLGWYQHLMSAMYKLYPEIVGLVDPHFKEKKEAQLGLSQSEDMDTDTVLENMVSVTGEAYHSEKLLALPEKRRQDGDENAETTVPNKRQKTELKSTPKVPSSTNDESNPVSLQEDKNSLAGSQDSSSSVASGNLSSSRQTCYIPCTSNITDAGQTGIPGTPEPAVCTSRQIHALSDEQQEELYQRIKKSFATKVHPNQLLIHLKLGTQDEEKVDEKFHREGRSEAAQYLLRIMMQRCPDWVDDICKGLRDQDIALAYFANEIEEARQEIIDAGTRQSKTICVPPCKHPSDENSALPAQNVQKDSTMNIVDCPANTCESDSDNEDRLPADKDRQLRVDTVTQNKDNVQLAEGKEEEEVDEPQSELSLRLYQAELAQDSLNGVNIIICAPTGSGKTIVAVKIMQEHMKKKGVRKIAFFANQNALIEQQFKAIREYMPKDMEMARVSGNNAETMKMPLSDVLAKNEILLMTPQILEDALKDGELSSLTEFTMLVFDECHHTNSRHVFNQIMFRYMEIKLDESIPDDRKCLPQIVGLTASVGVGGSKDIRGAVEHIKNLCANLDAYGGVTTVQENKADLAKYTGTTSTEFQKTEGRKEDIFKNVVSEKLMKTIEEMMAKSNYVATIKGVKNFEDILKPPSDKVEQQYGSWLSILFREVAKITDPIARRFFMANRSHLEIYHKSLSINADCQTKDALKRLEEDLGQLHTSHSVMDDTDTKLMKLYEKFKPLLKSASENPLCINPKLTALKRTILEPFSQEPDCRVMVFVKTRYLASALLDWMKEDLQLTELNPGIFVGQSASSNKGGMSRHEQDQSAQLFRKGDNKIMVATSVAEEGMDFSKCNLVIQYEYVTNEIAMVQARGRARAENSSFVIVTDTEKRIADKEELNMSREMMMNRALIQLQQQVKTDNQQFREDIITLQQTAKAGRDNEATRGGHRVLLDGDFVLRCVKCDALACFSTDIRTIEKNHHAVLPEEFQARIRVKPHPKAMVELRDFKIASKITCFDCGHDWGVAIIYRNATFPVIKINSFVIIDSHDRRVLAKKWNKAPFEVPEMKPEEFRDYKSLELES